MKRANTLAVLLVVIGLGSLAVSLAYMATMTSYPKWSLQSQNQQGMMGLFSQQARTSTGTTITLEQAKAIAAQYLASTNNPNLAIKEVMEFQYNFYVMYYEKDTGIGAFEMLIWKQVPASGMMGGGMGVRTGWHMATGVIVPEPGPNMMWNTKYSNMGYNVMGQGMMGTRNQAASTMAISKDRALQLAQAYLDRNFNGARVEQDAMQFYGYYTIDFTVDGKIAGMLSVNGQTGQVWYHSWHGAFVQEIEME